jgi:D-alanyl-D-alanine carboxypeptidase
MTIARMLQIAAMVTLVGCAGRAGRPASSDETRVSSATPPTDAAAPSPNMPSEPPPPEPSPPPVERLAWVNPARCVTPCALDPQASLVRVGERGDEDPNGAHRIDRAIQAPLRELVSAAHAAGHKIKIESAFRSYEDQDRVFRQVKQKGRAARPGHSEHQLGTAVDFRMPTTAAMGWLAEHAADHGFALSYPDGKQRITGYRPEPWHVRFVGRELANELRTTGASLEELFRARPELGESGTCDDCPLPASRAGACDGITESGRCDGTVLHWCYAGVLATVDCAASKQRCGRASGSQEYDCVRK